MANQSAPAKKFNLSYDVPEKEKKINQICGGVTATTASALFDHQEMFQSYKFYLRIHELFLLKIPGNLELAGVNEKDIDDKISKDAIQRDKFFTSWKVIRNNEPNFNIFAAISKFLCGTNAASKDLVLYNVSNFLLNIPRHKININYNDIRNDVLSGNCSPHLLQSLADSLGLELVVYTPSTSKSVCTIVKYRPFLESTQNVIYLLKSSDGKHHPMFQTGEAVRIQAQKTFVPVQLSPDGESLKPVQAAAHRLVSLFDWMSNRHESKQWEFHEDLVKEYERLFANEIAKCMAESAGMLMPGQCVDNDFFRESPTLARLFLCTRNHPYGSSVVMLRGSVLENQQFQISAAICQSICNNDQNANILFLMGARRQARNQGGQVTEIASVPFDYDTVTSLGIYADILKSPVQVYLIGKETPHVIQLTPKQCQLKRPVTLFYSFGKFRALVPHSIDTDLTQLFPTTFVSVNCRSSKTGTSYLIAYEGSGAGIWQGIDAGPSQLNTEWITPSEPKAKDVRCSKSELAKHVHQMLPEDSCIDGILNRLRDTIVSELNAFTDNPSHFPWSECASRAQKILLPYKVDLENALAEMRLSEVMGNPILFQSNAKNFSSDDKKLSAYTQLHLKIIKLTSDGLCLAKSVSLCALGSTKFYRQIQLLSAYVFLTSANFYMTNELVQQQLYTSFNERAFQLFASFSNQLLTKEQYESIGAAERNTFYPHEISVVLMGHTLRRNIVVLMHNANRKDYGTMVAGYLDFEAHEPFIIHCSDHQYEPVRVGKKITTEKLSVDDQLNYTLRRTSQDIEEHARDIYYHYRFAYNRGQLDLKKSADVDVTNAQAASTQIKPTVEKLYTDANIAFSSMHSAPFYMTEISGGIPTLHHKTQLADLIEEASRIKMYKLRGVRVSNGCYYISSSSVGSSTTPAVLGTIINTSLCLSERAQVHAYIRNGMEKDSYSGVSYDVVLQLNYSDLSSKLQTLMEEKEYGRKLCLLQSGSVLPGAFGPFLSATEIRNIGVATLHLIVVDPCYYEKLIDLLRERFADFDHYPSNDKFTMCSLLYDRTVYLEESLLLEADIKFHSVELLAGGVIIAQSCAFVQGYAVDYTLLEIKHLTMDHYKHLYSPTESKSRLSSLCQCKEHNDITRMGLELWQMVNDFGAFELGPAESLNGKSGSARPGHPASDHECSEEPAEMEIDTEEQIETTQTNLLEAQPMDDTTNLISAEDTEEMENSGNVAVGVDTEEHSPHFDVEENVEQTSKVTPEPRASQRIRGGVTKSKSLHRMKTRSRTNTTIKTLYTPAQLGYFMAGTHLETSNQSQDEETGTEEGRAGTAPEFETTPSASRKKSGAEFENVTDNGSDDDEDDDEDSDNNEASASNVGFVGEQGEAIFVPINKAAESIDLISERQGTSTRPPRFQLRILPNTQKRKSTQKRTESDKKAKLTKQYKCGQIHKEGEGQCELEFRTKKALTKHQEDNTVGNRKFPCGECIDLSSGSIPEELDIGPDGRLDGKVVVFKTLDALKKHGLTHLPKRWMCSKCKQKFVREQHVIRHQTKKGKRGYTACRGAAAVFTTEEEQVDTVGQDVMDEDKSGDE